MSKCIKCGESFTTKRRLQNHVDNQVCDKKYCTTCKKPFGSERDLLRHKNSKTHKRLAGIETAPTELEIQTKKLEKLTKELNKTMKRVEQLTGGAPEIKEKEIGNVYNHCTFIVGDNNNVTFSLVQKYQKEIKECKILRMGDLDGYYQSYSASHLSIMQQKNPPPEKILGNIHKDIICNTDLPPYLSENREMVICDHGGGKFPKQDYLEEVRKTLVLEFVVLHNLANKSQNKKVDNIVRSLFYSLLELEERERSGINKESLLEEYLKTKEEIDEILINSMEHLADDSLIPDYDDRTKPSQYKFGIPKLY
nr:hypothetical protein K-LCC10_0008 [Kaumoebavirus]